MMHVKTAKWHFTSDEGHRPLAASQVLLKAVTSEVPLASLTQNQIMSASYHQLGALQKFWTVIHINLAHGRLLMPQPGEC